MSPRLAVLLLAVSVVTTACSRSTAVQATGTAAPPTPPAAGAVAQQRSSPPALIVLVVVDQMRADYLTRMRDRWTGGMRRLLDEGAIFEEARYPYLNTVTCAGHATIGTGAFPATHGIALNEWWDRAGKTRMPCTRDESVQPVPYGGTPEPIGHSAQQLRIPTFGDRLRESVPSSHVVSVSMKPRSAVMMAGHGGTVTWFSDTNSWATSTAYTKMPIPSIASFLQANPVDALRSIVWDRVDAGTAYSGDDAVPGERARRGWTNAFPHPLSGAPGSGESTFYDLWERSPYSDVYLGRMAAALAERFGLGTQDGTDFLAVSFSGLDYVGHDFGPDSHEAQDTAMRLDRTLGELFEVLDTQVGRDNYVVALSADHGVAPIPEARRAAGLDAGRVDLEAIRIAGEKALAALGPGPHIADIQYTDLYLADETRAHVEAHPDALKPLMDVIAAQPGVLRVLAGAPLAHARASADPIERAVALSHAEGRSGDVMIVPKPYWLMTGSSATTHGTLHDYDQQVPVIFLGRPFKPGRYRDAASPADIMPTLASLVGVPMPGVDGHVLEVAKRP